MCFVYTCIRCIYSKPSLGRRLLIVETLNQIKLNSYKTNTTEKLTSAEMGKLWATYMGNIMSKMFKLLP
jgi:hypothetical protein